MEVQINQHDYELGVFLTRLSYYDLDYPPLFKCIHSLDNFSGLRMNVFERGKFYYVIICGTNGLSIRDWWANIQVGLGFIPMQHKECLNFFKMIPHDKPVVIFSHSLGGGIGEYVVANQNREDVLCFALNGCGVKHLGGYVEEGKILNVITSRDILNGIASKLPGKNYMKHYGGVNYIKDNTTWNPIKSHSNFEVMMKYNVEK